MNRQKLQESIDWIKKELGGGLLMTDIWQEGGTQLIGDNFQKAIDCFDVITQTIRKQVEAAGALPPTATYYAVEFADEKVVVVFVKGSLRWGLLVDVRAVEIGKALALGKQAVAHLEAAAS